MYYGNNFRNNSSFGSRSSIRQGGFRPRNGGFNRQRSFGSQNRGGGQRRSKLEGADINMFIKKPISAGETQAQTATQNFSDFEISDYLKVNIQN
ncbi:MAG: hypothetical protein AAB414_03725, partial [Patescibacteria group bacterium]